MTHAERHRRVAALHAVACEHNATSPEKRLAVHLHPSTQAVCISFSGKGIEAGRAITVSYGQCVKRAERSFRKFVRHGGGLADCVALCSRLRATLEEPKAKAVLLK